jgi:hypothetical protein
MRLVKRVQLMGRGATFGALAGLAAGLALAVPGAPSASGVIHAVLAGAGVTAPPPTTEHPGPTSPPPSTTVTTEHPWTEDTSTTTAVKPKTEPTTSTTTSPTATTEPTASGGPTTPTGAGDPPSGPATCEGTITAFKVVLVDGGRGIQLTVLVSGHVGWMSAYAEGFGGAALSPITGGFQGTITGHEPVAPGTKVLVGSCGNRVRASAVVGSDGAPPSDATPPGDPTTTAPSSPTTTAPSVTSSDLPAGCSTASITSVTAMLLDGGLEVRGAVQVDGSVGWMSGAIEGPGGSIVEGITLQAVTGGFVGTATSSTPFPAGSTLVVGTCGGKLRGSAPVLAVT